MKEPDSIENNRSIPGNRLLPVAVEMAVNPSQLTIDKENIVRGLGMSMDHADNYLIGLIDSIAEICQKLAQPRVSFVVFQHPQFDHENYTIQLDDQIFNTGKLVTNLLKKSENIALFIATIGSGIEAYSRQQMAGSNGLEGYIADLIGSELAECTAELVHYHIEETVKTRGLKVTNRYSPGYCNWPVSDQLKLFSLFSNHAGVSLSSSSLMLPIKSVSGMLGIGRDVRIAKYKCNLCDDEKCIMRKG